MARYRTTIDSVLPPTRAFDYLADFSSSEEWDPGVVEAQRLDEGAVGVGSKFRVVSRFAGRDVPLQYEIVELDPGRKVVLRAESKTVVSLDTISFAPREGGSSVTYDADLRLKGVAKLLDPVLAVLFRRIGDQARDGLRRVLGSAAADESGR